MTLVARDTLAHYKFVAHDVGELEERVAHQESQPANLRKDKDYVPNDQVWALYHQAQDKLGASRQSQMLKEVTNICSSKKPSVCVEAQKQAIEFEKESRRLQHARIQQYHKEQLKEQSKQ